MTEQPLKTWYVTKWWETRGILETQGYLYDDKYVSCHTASITSPWRFGLLRLGNQAFATREKAEADVQKRAQRKIASLRKQLAKLEKEYPSLSEKPRHPYYPPTRQRWND